MTKYEHGINTQNPKELRTLEGGKGQSKEQNGLVTPKELGD
jgi:hypothetical protein